MSKFKRHPRYRGCIIQIDKHMSSYHHGELAGKCRNIVILSPTLKTYSLVRCGHVFFTHTVTLLTYQSEYRDFFLSWEIDSSHSCFFRRQPLNCKSVSNVNILLLECNADRHILNGGGKIGWIDPPVLKIFTWTTG